MGVLSFLSAVVWFGVAAVGAGVGVVVVAVVGSAVVRGRCCSGWCCWLCTLLMFLVLRSSFCQVGVAGDIAAVC